MNSQAENAAEQLLRALKPVEACHLCGTSGLRKQVETLIFKTERLLNAGYCMDLVAQKTSSEGKP